MVLLVVCVHVYLPESLDSSDQSKEMLSMNSVYSRIKEFVKEFQSRTFFALMAASSVFTIAISASGLYFTYLSYRFGWDSLDFGTYKVVSSLAVTAQLFVIFPTISNFLRKYAGDSAEKSAALDIRILIVAILIAAAGQFIITITTSQTIIYLLVATSSCASICAPIITSLLSGLVPSNQQGVLFSFMGLITSLAAIFGNTVFPMIWTSTVEKNPNVYLYLEVTILVIAAACLTLTRSKELVEFAETSEDEPIENE
jgi:MFS family permease